MASGPDDKKERGIRALNQEFRRYEQVRKDQAYGLSEVPERDEFDDEFRIQTCDMGLWFQGGDQGRRQFAQQLGEALEGIGFAILTGHRVKPQVHRQARAKIVEFFETTTPGQRNCYVAQRHGSVNQGYFPMKETTLIHPDLVEGWVFCRRAFRMEEGQELNESSFWPAPGFEATFREVCLAQEKLILPVMQSILTYLGCDPGLYDDKLTGTNFGFRLNYYPPVAEGQAVPAGGRMLGHEDVDLFTFLPAPTQEGLQVLNRANMKWVRLDAPPGSIILNTGDYMQRISNDRLPSTTHRVSQPRGGAALRKPRVSFPMAIYVWEDEVLEVLPGLGEPRYEPISAIKFHTAITSKYYGDDYAVDD